MAACCESPGFRRAESFAGSHYAGITIRATGEHNTGRMKH